MKEKERKAQYKARLKDDLNYDDDKKTEERIKKKEREADLSDNDNKKMEEGSKGTEQKARYRTRQREKENYTNTSNSASNLTIPNISTTVDTDAPLKMVVEALSRTSTNMHDSKTDEKLQLALA
eukprot:14192279-Ditylum_brightwellii.AAC.1